MRILFALTMFTLACGSAPAKKESAIVNEKEVAPTCCCKTIPPVGEHEIQPVYAMSGRMECSTNNGECVDDVQCNAQEGDTTTSSGGDSPPPPPTLEPETESGIGNE